METLFIISTLVLVAIVTYTYIGYPIVLLALVKVKQLFTKKDPLLTRETAEIAQMHVYFNAEKILKFLPGFRFKPLSETISQYCSEYLVKMMN